MVLVKKKCLPMEAEEGLNGVCKEWHKKKNIEEQIVQETTMEEIQTAIILEMLGVPEEAKEGMDAMCK